MVDESVIHRKQRLVMWELVILPAWLIWICPMLSPVERSGKSKADISIGALASHSGSIERYLEIKALLLSL